MSFPTSNSFNNLYEIIRKTEQNKKVGYFSTKIIKFLISFTKILETCDGRDKLSAFIQYSAKFYATCLYHAIDLENNSTNEE